MTLNSQTWYQIQKLKTSNLIVSKIQAHQNEAELTLDLRVRFAIQIPAVITKECTFEAKWTWHFMNGNVLLAPQTYGNSKESRVVFFKNYPLKWTCAIWFETDASK